MELTRELEIDYLLIFSIVAKSLGERLTFPGGHWKVLFKCHASCHLHGNGLELSHNT